MINRISFSSPYPKTRKNESITFKGHFVNELPPYEELAFMFNKPLRFIIETIDPFIKQMKANMARVPDIFEMRIQAATVLTSEINPKTKELVEKPVIEILETAAGKPYFYDSVFLSNRDRPLQSIMDNMH